VAGNACGHTSLIPLYLIQLLKLPNNFFFFQGIFLGKNNSNENILLCIAYFLHGQNYKFFDDNSRPKECCEAIII
jgi:hypothetical protein